MTEDITALADAKARLEPHRAAPIRDFLANCDGEHNWDFWTVIFLSDSPDITPQQVSETVDNILTSGKTVHDVLEGWRPEPLWSLLREGSGD